MMRSETQLARPKTPQVMYIRYLSHTLIDLMILNLFEE